MSRKRPFSIKKQAREAALRERREIKRMRRHPEVTAQDAAATAEEGRRHA